MNADSVKSIEPDEQAILALERLVTGATSHEIRGLIHAYRNWCYVGNAEKMALSKRAMYNKAIEIYRKTCTNKVA